jgi:signal transduction histidine kinase
VASTALALLVPDRAAERPWATLGLAALAAAWLPLVSFTRPYGVRAGASAWTGHVRNIVYYAGVLAVGGALLSLSPYFSAFAWIGYPLGFTLFSARWSTPAVMVTALAGLGAQGGLAGDASPGSLIAGLAMPVLFAGWYVGRESDRRRALVAELSSANEALTTALRENAGLRAQLLHQAREAGVLDERQRMAREIHDTIAQGLIALITQLRAANKAPAGSDASRRHLGLVEDLATRTLTEARRSVQAMRPEPLDRSQLPDALRDLAGRWSGTAGVPAAVEVTGTVRPLITGIEVTLFRVAQEALANVARHAAATRAGVTLSYLDDVVLLDIRDDGTGFDPRAPRGSGGAGFGLDSMRQRVAEAGGTLTVETAPGQGTTVAVSVPAIERPADTPGTAWNPGP